jgi:hypothetical protein
MLAGDGMPNCPEAPASGPSWTLSLRYETIAAPLSDPQAPARMMVAAPAMTAPAAEKRI